MTVNVLTHFCFHYNIFQEFLFKTLRNSNKIRFLILFQGCPSSVYSKASVNWLTTFLGTEANPTLAILESSMYLRITVTRSLCCEHPGNIYSLHIFCTIICINIQQISYWFLFIFPPRISSVFFYFSSIPFFISNSELIQRYSTPCHTMAVKLLENQLQASANHGQFQNHTCQLPFILLWT